VAEAGNHRDARARNGGEDADGGVPTAAGGRRRSAFDVPDIDEPPKRDRDGGELVN
jgi:hypothetical protein